MRMLFYKLIDWFRKGRGGLRWECTGCGGCCRRRGSVFLTREEVQDAAAHLGISEHAFRVRYSTAKFDGLYEIFTEEACPLLETGNRCTIYPVRPQQCRTYPFWRSAVGSAAKRRRLKR